MNSTIDVIDNAPTANDSVTSDKDNVMEVEEHENAAVAAMSASAAVAESNCIFVEEIAAPDCIVVDDDVDDADDAHNNQNNNNKQANVAASEGSIEMDVERDEIALNVTPTPLAQSLDVDPMDLLEPVEMQYDAASNYRYDHESDNYSDKANDLLQENNTDSDSDNTTQADNREEKWQSWMENFSWLLHDENDEPTIGYCFYCDYELCVSGTSHLQRHTLSQKHRELEEMYMIFQSSNQINNSAVDSIKQEFGNCSNVSAIKYKRKCERENFEQFIWQHWKQAHPWLVKLKGYTGYCKICKSKVTAIISHIRENHEESQKHQDALAILNRQKETDKNEEIPAAPVAVISDDEQSQVSSNTSPSAYTIASTKSLWLEMIDEPQMCRCKLCKTKMNLSSFRKHLKSQIHLSNVQNHLQNQTPKECDPILIKPIEEPKPNVGYWAALRRIHPWLCPDSNYPYCKYCQKRLIYGQHASKRIQHENSAEHFAAEKEYVKKKCAINNDDKQEPNDATENQETTNENANQAEQNGNEQMMEQEAENDDEDKDYVPEEEEEEENDEEENEQAQETMDLETDMEEVEEDNEGEKENEKEKENEERENEKGKKNEKDDDEEDTTESEQDAEAADEQDEKEKEEKGVTQKTKKAKVAANKEQSNTDKNKRISRGSTEWFGECDWAKEYRKDSRYCFCKYCKVLLLIDGLNRRKHEQTLRHIEAQKETRSKPFNIWLKTKKSFYCRPCQQHYSLKINKMLHEQTSAHKSFLKKFRERLISKKQKYKKHEAEEAQDEQEEDEEEEESQQQDEEVEEKETDETDDAEQIVEKDNTKKVAAKEAAKIKQNANSTAKSVATSKRVATTSAKTAAVKKLNIKKIFITTRSNVAANSSLYEFEDKIQRWSHKFPWLQVCPDKKINYGFCQICQANVFASSFKIVARHCKATKHMIARKKIEAKSVATNKEQDKQENTVGVDEQQKNNETSDPPQAAITLTLPNRNTDLVNTETENQYPWLVADSNLKKGYCKYCEIRLKIRGPRKLKHQRSPSHRAAERLYLSRQNPEKSSSSKRMHSESDDDSSSNASTDETEVLPAKRTKISSGPIHKKAKRLTKCHQKLLRLVGHTPPLNVLANPFDAAACLRGFENSTNGRVSSAMPIFLNQQGQLHVVPTSAATTTTTTTAKPTSPKRNIELFFESISETVKNWPTDLAAECKLKVMKTVYDIELTVMKRQELKEQQEQQQQQQQQQQTSNLREQSNGQTLAYADLAMSRATATATTRSLLENGSIDEPHSSSSSFMHANSNSENNRDVQTFMRNLPTTKLTASSPQKTVRTTYAVDSNNILLGNALHRLPKNSTVSVATKSTANTDNTQIRCVPINRLTQNISTSSTSPQRSSLITHIRLNSGNNTNSNAKTHTLFNAKRVESNTTSNVRLIPSGTIQQLSSHISPRALSNVGASSSGTNSGKYTLKYTTANSRNVQ